MTAPTVRLTTVLLALALPLIGCGQDPNGQASLPAPPERIISLAPSITEIVFALGAGERLVGRTELCRWPAEAAAIPTVGMFHNMDWERLQVLEPDLVIFFEALQDSMAPLRSMGIAGLATDFDTVAEVHGSIRAIAERLGVATRGEALVTAMTASLDGIAARLADLEPRPTLLLIGREPGTFQALYAAGPDSFVSELAARAGAVNVLGPSLGPFPPISREMLIGLDPAVIIDTCLEGSDPVPAVLQRERALYAREFPDLRAVRDGRVVLWTDPHLTIPGPAMAAQIERLARAIHPEAFD